MTALEKTPGFTAGRLRVGFLVNPFAGIGGPAANKGSDDTEIKARAISGELPLRAPARAQQFLQALCKQLEANELPEFIVAPAAMGADIFRSEKIACRTTDLDLSFPCSAVDTVAQAAELMASGIDLLLFVGGDGTARDVCAAVESNLPVLGIPSGVKMHSGVFAVTPEAAAEVLRKILRRELTLLTECEVRDIDEQAFRQGKVKSRWFGDMLVPTENQFVQHVKQGGMEVEELVLLDIAEELRGRLNDFDEPVLVIFGPGSTTHFVLDQLGITPTLLGVDVIEYAADAGAKLLASDIDATSLFTIAIESGLPIYLVITAIGGQGHIIGRGNQQLSPELLRYVGKENTWVIATKTKLERLENRPLLIDSGDPKLDSDWAGLMPVICGYRDVVLYSVGWQCGDQIDRSTVSVGNRGGSDNRGNSDCNEVQLVERVLKHCAEKQLPGSVDSRRLFHGRGGTFEGLHWCCVDWFAPVVLVTLFKEPIAGFESLLISALQTLFTGTENFAVLVQRRYLPGAPTDSVLGEIPEPWLARRKSLCFYLSARQQNVGFFLDIEPARQWLEQQACGKRVLNLFAYTCVFSAVAVAAGAERVVNIDMSKASISVGKNNHRLNQFAAERAKLLPHNIFKSWGKLRKEGPYDLAIIDPPSYQKGSFVADNDYVKVLRKMDELIAEGGLFLACLNAPETTAAEFKTMLDSACDGFEFVERLAPSEDFPDIDSERALKMFVYKKLS